jgi:hypothetical protein
MPCLNWSYALTFQQGVAFLVTPFLSKNVEVLTIIKEGNQVKREMGTGKTGKKIEDSFLPFF